MKWFVIVDSSDWGGDVVNGFEDREKALWFITEALNDDEEMGIENFHVIEGKEHTIQETFRVKLGDPEP
jgi:hypothetical protein